MGESRMAAFKELAFASSILEDSFNTSAVRHVHMNNGPDPPRRARIS